MLRSPRALLLDFGGVLVDAPAPPPAPPNLVERLHALAREAVSVERIRQDLADGKRRYAHWRDGAGTEQRPAELTHEQVWDRFIAAGWPVAVRDVVRQNASELSYVWSWNDAWVVRPGIPEALRAASTAGLPLAVVSNALCGAAHRDFLAASGLGGLFAVQLYSDEVGVRKPNPELAWLAARQVGVPIGDCWFVGDMVNRDVRCARRAVAGAAVLMRSSRVERLQGASDIEPDVTIDDGYGLLDLLNRSLRSEAAGPGQAG